MAVAQKLPTLFISHGGGPCFFMEAQEGSPIKNLDKNSKAAKWYKQLASQLNLHAENKPKALLIVSAHWEESPVKVHTGAKPKLLFDYYGFPQHTYQLEYPAPGNPELANEVLKLLTDAGIQAEPETKRGWDHGIFVPLKLLYPEADIPIVQLSLNSNLDPQLHFNIGKALAPLREQGVLIIGSGYAVHDLSFRISDQEATAFVADLRRTITELTGEERENALKQWSRFANAKKAHPREEHLAPIFVAAGAASDGAAQTLNDGKLIEPRMSLESYRFD